MRYLPVPSSLSSSLRASDRPCLFLPSKFPSITHANNSLSSFCLLIKHMLLYPLLFFAPFSSIFHAIESASIFGLPNALPPP